MSNRFLSMVAVSLTLAAGSWSVPSAAAELDETSVKLFNMQKAAAERDPSPQAQYYLAQMYEHGLGTAEDTNKARELYQRAADKGLMVARLQLKELERAEHEAQIEQQRAGERAAASRTNAAAKVSNAKVAAAIDEEAAEAARRADREKARAERKRRAMELLRQATAAAKAGNPFGEE